MSTAFFSHAECRLHDMGAGHPECPQRLDAIHDQLRASGIDMALDFHDAPEATLEQLERAHTAGYVTQLQETMRQVREAGGEVMEMKLGEPDLEKVFVGVMQSA